MHGFYSCVSHFIVHEETTCLCLKGGGCNQWSNTLVGQACPLVRWIASAGTKQQGVTGQILFNCSALPVFSNLLSVPLFLVFLTRPMLLILGLSVALPTADWRQSLISQENLWALFW